MATTPEHDKRVAELKFSSVYPHYVTKVEKKGRSIDELHQVISWLTGYTESEILEFTKNQETFESFFAKAKLHPNAEMIKGSICGYKIQEITTPLTKQARYLDKMVDELAKGKKMEKILRTKST